MTRTTRQTIRAAALVLGLDESQAFELTATHVSVGKEKAQYTLSKCIRVEEPCPGSYYCSLCGETSDLIQCTECSSQVCLSRCLPSLKSKARTGYYTCPACHLEKDRVSGTSTPYTGFNDKCGPLSLSSVFGHRSNLIPLTRESVLVLVIRLDDPTMDCEAPRMVLSHLSDFLPHKVKDRVLTFNYSTRDLAKRYDDSITSVAEDLKVGGELGGITRISIFLVTHSDPDRGDLHVLPAMKGASPVRAVLQALFPESLLAELRRRNRDGINMFLLAGGAFWAVPDHVAALRQFSKSANLHHLLGFSNQSLRTAYANTFLCLAAELFLVEGTSAYLPKALTESARLGSHTSVVHLYGATGTLDEYIWSHPVQRPFGQAIPIQCPGCFRLQNLALPQFSDKDRTIQLRCKSCESTQTFHQEPELQRFTRSTGKSPSPQAQASGDWYKRRLLNASDP